MITETCGNLDMSITMVQALDVVLQMLSRSD